MSRQGKLLTPAPGLTADRTPHHSGDPKGSPSRSVTKRAGATKNDQVPMAANTSRSILKGRRLVVEKGAVPNRSSADHAAIRASIM